MQELERRNQPQNEKEHKKELKREEKEEKERLKKLKTVPHFVNLNEDPILSGVVFHFLERKRVVIGKDTTDPLPDLPLSGLSIRREHAVLTIKGKKDITLQPGMTMARTKVCGTRRRRRRRQKEEGEEEGEEAEEEEGEKKREKER